MSQFIRILALFSLASIAACSSKNTGPIQGASETESLRIAFLSCVDPVETGAWSTLEKLAPDAVLFLGDNLYISPTKPEKLEDFAAAYSKLGHAPGFQNLSSKIPTLAIWDDHDFGSADGDSSFQHLDKASRAFREFWTPLRKRHALPMKELEGSPVGGTITLGNIKLILTDNRSFRLNPGLGEATIFGKRQLLWLEEQLKDANTKLSLIASGNQILTATTKYESFAQHPQHQQETMRIISEATMPTLILSGDRHFSEILQREHNRKVLTELTSSSVSERLAPSSIIEASDYRRRLIQGTANFAILEIDDRNSPSAYEVIYYDLEGEVLLRFRDKLKE